MQSYMTNADLEKKFAKLQSSGKDKGTIELIVCRPKLNERKILTEAEITIEEGLVGDYWISRHVEGVDNTKMQITLINTSIMRLIAGKKENWAPAGDQLYVDFDLSQENLPIGQKISLGSDNKVILEITDIPHTGCDKFMNRYGKDATLFVNASERKHLRLRGVNAKVLKSGKISVNDRIEKI